MREISVPFDRSILTKHQCRLAVFNCVDFRFRQKSQEAIEKAFGSDFDYYSHPGGAKNFAGQSLLQDEFINAIEKVSLGLHGATELLILCHWDCGAYGGSEAFESAEAEERAYMEDLKTARQVLGRRFPKLSIRTGYTIAIGEELVLRIV